MTAFIIILAALHFAAPIRCYTSQPAWDATVPFTFPVLAYYHGDPADRYIALSPETCRNVQAPTLEGANVLAHELAHAWQDDHGLLMTETQADRLALRWQRHLLRTLERFYGRAAKVLLPDPPPVRLVTP